MALANLNNLIYFFQFMYFVDLHIVGKIQFYQTFMGTQNKYGILYGGKIRGFLV